MMLVLMVLAALTIISLGLDFSHVVAVRAQLRNAADAAALAGAQQLFSDPSTCKQYALWVAQKNIADGLNVKNTPNVIDVNATTVPPVGANMGTVTVDITMTLKDIISPIFGRMLDNVHVVAVAGAAGKVVTTYKNTVFPLAVSLDEVPSAQGKGTAGPSLLQAIEDGSNALTIYVNSQSYKNGAFTSFTDKQTNANWLNNAIDQALGIPPKQSVEIPPVSIGEDIYLNNGNVGQQRLASDPEFSQLTAPDRVIVLPVMSGKPAYNQTRRCIGFVAVHVDAVNKPHGNGIVESLHVQLRKIAIPGVTGTLPSTGIEEWDTALYEIDPSTIKLLQ